MRSNKKYSADELVVFIEKHLNDWISYRILVQDYGLSLNRTSFKNYVSKYRAYGMKGLLSKKADQSYSRAFKEQMVQEYLNTTISYRELALKYQVPEKETIRQWVLRYTEEKENTSYSPLPEVYTMKSRKTTVEERIHIVEECLDHQLSYKETAQKHQVSYNNVYSWVQKYKNHGPAGLVDNRGRRKQPEIQTEEEKLKAKIVALEARNKWLDMENQTLKKQEEIERRLMSRKSDKNRRT